MSGKHMVWSYGHSMELKTSIQPITARKIVAQPIGMPPTNTQMSLYLLYSEGRDCGVGGL